MLHSKGDLPLIGQQRMEQSSSLFTYATLKIISSDSVFKDESRGLMQLGW